MHISSKPSAVLMQHLQKPYLPKDSLDNVDKISFLLETIRSTLCCLVFRSFATIFPPKMAFFDAKPSALKWLKVTHDLR